MFIRTGWVDVNHNPGDDVLAGHEMRAVGHDRVLVGYAMVGGAAVGMNEIDLFVGGVSIGRIATSSVGLGVKRGDVLSTRVRIGAGVPVRAVMRTIVPGNTGILFLNFLP